MKKKPCNFSTLKAGALVSLTTQLIFCSTAYSAPFLSNLGDPFLAEIPKEVVPAWLNPQDKAYNPKSVFAHFFRHKTLYHIFRVVVATKKLVHSEFIEAQLRVLYQQTDPDINFEKALELLRSAAIEEALHHDRTKVDPNVSKNIPDRLARYDGIDKHKLSQSERQIFDSLINELNDSDHSEELYVLDRLGIRPRSSDPFMNQLGKFALALVEVVDKVDTHHYRSKEFGKNTIPASQYLKDPLKIKMAKFWEPLHLNATNHLSPPKMLILPCSSALQTQRH